MVGQDPLNGSKVDGIVVLVDDFSAVALARTVALVMAAVVDRDTARDSKFQSDFDAALASQGTETIHIRGMAVMTEPVGDGVAISIFRPSK